LMASLHFLIASTKFLALKEEKRASRDGPTLQKNELASNRQQLG
jgi:hypothetical protein